MTAQSPSRQIPTRRPPWPAAQRGGSLRGRARRRRRLDWRGWLAIAGATTLLALFAWAFLSRRFAPASNTDRTRFDAVIILGTPADDDGNPTPFQLARVNEAVHEYERGVAPRLIFTGGAAHNRFVEAKIMAQVANAQGIPQSALFVEPQAQDTIQNACYAVRMMKAHGWGSAEVISEGFHLPRAALIFSRLPIQWRTHAAPPPQPESVARRAWLEGLEELKTVRYLVWTRQYERCQP